MGEGAWGRKMDLARVGMVEKQERGWLSGGRKDVRGGGEGGEGRGPGGWEGVGKGCENLGEE